MSTAEEIKSMVRQKYDEIARTEPSASVNQQQQETSCCGGRTNSGPPPTPKACCGNGVSNLMADDYKDVKGYNPDADLGLGCGLPTQFARIRPGKVVLDLGSGAGNDCFVARAETGPTGRVIGVDFTPCMVERARANAERRGYTNVEFVHGDIEQLPLEDNMMDVVVSNCVLNLVPNKAAVFGEIMRVLKPGGHFSVSDIVVQGPPLPDHVRAAAEMYAGCVAGAMDMEDYLALIPAAGFTAVAVQKKKPIIVPRDILEQHLTADQVDAFESSGTGIFSISVCAEKPKLS